MFPVNSLSTASKSLPLWNACVLMCSVTGSSEENSSKYARRRMSQPFRFSHLNTDRKRKTSGSEATINVSRGLCLAGSKSAMSTASGTTKTLAASTPLRMNCSRPQEDGTQTSCILLIRGTQPSGTRSVSYIVRPTAKRVSGGGQGSTLPQPNAPSSSQMSGVAWQMATSQPGLSRPTSKRLPSTSNVCSGNSCTKPWLTCSANCFRPN
mmetsp:Transcript_87732/g.226102  ORF Transcript_87732/g.226102 Transcript_87732/m.226102 type:complete len:209 (-) Transcript_87732:240-866(-)